MHIIFILIISCTLVYSDCEFSKADERTNKLYENMKKWKNYGKTLTISSKTSSYTIGICASVDGTNNSGIIQRENNTTYILGKLNPINLVGGDNWIMLTYKQGDRYNNICDNSTRSASIMFICGLNMDNLTVLQEQTSSDMYCNYMFQLQIPEMCPVLVKDNKLSGGAIFLIVLFSSAAVYLIVGAIYMHVKHGARGLEHIPNFDMWRRIGHLAADGCNYCCRCERATPRPGYFFDESGPDMRADDDILSP